MAETTIQIFNKAEFGQIRIATDENDEPWFVAKDVCDVLGLGNAREACRHFDDDEKGVTIADTLGGRQKMTTVNEPGFYRLVLKSRKPEAKAFQRWVTHEVLPSIRKRGGYMVAKADETPEQVMARALLIAQETLERQGKELEEIRPKALFADAVSASSSTILVGDLAKLLRQNGFEVGQNRLFSILRDQGFLCRQKGAMWNMPTQRAMELGLFEVKETAITHSDGHVTINKTPKVTGKGQVYFVSRYCTQ